MEYLSRRFLWFLLIGVACYAGLVFFAQGEKFIASFVKFPFSYLPVLLILTFINYLLRYVRWHIYLEALGIRLGYWRSFQIFMAGLTMTITPGKTGEALKAHLLQREVDNPWSMGLPVVFAERLTDLIGVVLLVAIGFKVLPFGRDVALLGVALCLLLILVFVQPTLFKGIVRVLGKLPRMAEPSKRLLEMHGNVKRLMTPRLTLIAVLISCIAWFAECLVLFFALSACQGDASWLQSTFIYAFSTLIGALSILPGGLVATEGSMTGLLLFSGLERSQAVLVTFIVRFSTLWLAVFLGMVFLFFLQRRNRLKNSVVSKEKGAMMRVA